MSNVASGRMVSEDGTVVNVADTLNGVEVNTTVNVNSFGAKSGRMLDEDGNVVNIADVIGGVDTGKKADVNSYAPASGNFVREDGTVVNVTKALVEKLGGGGSGGGGGETTEPGKPYIDTSLITSFKQFCIDNRLNDYLVHLDTSNGTNFSYMFNGCSKLTGIPPLETSNGTNFTNMFNDCSALETIPQLDTSNGTNFSYMFSNCSKLTGIPQLDTSNGTSFTYIFFNCGALETVSLTTAKSDLPTNAFHKCTALKNITIGEGWAVNIYLHYSNELTVESLHGMIENLADLTGLTVKKFQVGETNLAKIDEDHIAMLETKNWEYS